MSVEVLACIPELDCPAGLEPEPEEAVSTTLPTPLVSPAPEPAPEAASKRMPRERRPRSTGFASPSIVVLAVVAAAVWAAAWRNDRLRLEAARQQRPERLAQELPATAGAARSVMP
jgi:hypothetical protein